MLINIYIISVNFQNIYLSCLDNVNTLEWSFITLGTDRTTHQAPVISSHLQNVQIQQGYKVTLDVITDETMPLSYQWYFENDKITGT